MNPENLRWARETAALSVEQAARKIGLSGPMAVGHLREMESGEREPTSRNLARMAKAYHRPMLALYMGAPPPKGSRAHDLRTIHGETQVAEAELDAIVRDARVRQSILRDALEDEDEVTAVAQVGLCAQTHDAIGLAAAIQTSTAFDLRNFRAQRSIEAAFATAREAVERLGIYVLLIGDLGHHTSKVSQKVYRGISLPDPIVPFIIINDNDAKSAWTFTLMHEVAHVFLGESAISGYGSDVATERLCDDTASRLLVPRSDLDSVPIRAQSFDEQVHEIGLAARRWKVSRRMVAYNLMRTEKITPSLYNSLAERFDEDRLEFAAAQRSAGGDYYITRTHRLGRSLINTVGRMLATSTLTTRKASIVLGVKPTNVGTLTESAR